MRLLECMMCRFIIPLKLEIILFLKNIYPTLEILSQKSVLILCFTRVSGWFEKQGRLMLNLTLSLTKFS